MSFMSFELVDRSNELLDCNPFTPPIIRVNVNKNHMKVMTR